MPTENEASTDRERTAQIVAAYVRHHKLSGDQLALLISDVYQALGNIGKAPEPMIERTPAVSIRRSVSRDAVICIDCGWKGFAAI
jgi:predicted transcriptional regulator